MKRLALVVIALAVFAAPGALAQDAARLLKAAINTEMVDGDPKAAIEQYKKVVASGIRPLAAEALLRMAGCYQKLGDAEAQKIYAQIVANYADQTKVVAEARARMVAGAAVSSQNGLATRRPLWTLKTGDWVTGQMSSDARLVAYATQASGDYPLAIHDLQTGTDRVVAQRMPGESFFMAMSSAFSRDGQKLAYRVEMSAGSRDFVQMRVIDLAGPTGQSTQPLFLLEHSHPKMGPRPFDWTPDGKWIAVTHQKDALTWEYGLVSSTDGSLRVLKTLKFGGRFRPTCYLSPDGKFFAAEVPEDTAGATNIVVIPVDGSPEIPVVDFKGRDTLMGWTADGRGLLFTSERAGSNALWYQRIESGRLQGQPEPLVRNFGPPGWSSLVTSGGALYGVSGDLEESSVMEAAFDFATGTFVAPPRYAADTFIRSNTSPRWSPDGKRLAYVSLRSVAGERPIRVPVIRTLETGESRDMPIHFGFQAWAWDWLPDSKAIAMVGVPQDADPNVARGLYRIDIETGLASPIVLGNATGRPLRSADGRTLFYTRATARPVPAGQQPWLVVARDLASGVERATPSADLVDTWTIRRSPDGRKEYEGRPTSNGRVLVERDLSTGTERELLRLFGDVSWNMTADGRSIIATTVDTNTTEGVIVLCSLADGAVRTVFKSERGQQLHINVWSPDSGSAIVESPRAGGLGEEFWWVPFDGRPAKPLRELTGSDVMSRFELHPDGRRLAFEVRLRGRSAEQLWVIDNLLPTTKR
jgi:Tol biopolymer transport system component